MTPFGFVRRVKRKLISRLAWQVMEEEARLRAATKVCAIVSPTATLAPEAAIVNGADNPDLIVIGDHSFVRAKLLVFPYGGEIRVGDWCYIGHRTEIWSMASVTIGHRVFVAHDVNIIDTTAHSRDPRERHRQYQRTVSGEIVGNTAPPLGVDASSITIEDDAWINFNVTILRGVRIGRGSIIAAGAMVTRDVPPYTLYRCQITPVITPLQDLP